MYPNCTFLKKILFSNFLKLKFPYKLTFALTYKCNLRCKTCSIWKKEKKSELSIEQIEKFFKKSNRFSWLDLTGGEIFLREDLEEVAKIILKHCRSLCIFHFPTNGQLTDKIVGFIEKIRQYRTNIAVVVTVSMDGPEEVNNEIRGCKEAWGRSLRTFIELRERGFRFAYLGYTLSDYNFNRLEEMFASVKGHYRHIRRSDIHINIAHTSKHYLNNADMNFDLQGLFNEEIKNYVRKRGNAIKSFLERRYFELLPSYISLKRMPLRCQALSSSCFIDPYGDIYPCTIHDRKITNISDIDYDLSKLWAQDNVAGLRGEILDKKCKGCWTPCEAYPAILGSLFKPN